ncbi:hypothetical protein BKA81DRAFT_358117 [Phyllosticta paracitricarpa]
MEFDRERNGSGYSKFWSSLSIRILYRPLALLTHHIATSCYAELCALLLDRTHWYGLVLVRQGCEISPRVEDSAFHPSFARPTACCCRSCHLALKSPNQQRHKTAFDWVSSFRRKSSNKAYPLGYLELQSTKGISGVLALYMRAITDFFVSCSHPLLETFVKRVQNEKGYEVLEEGISNPDDGYRSRTR